MFRFPKTLRLLRRADFREALDHGIKVTDHNFVFVARPVDGAGVRVGLIVSKKVGGAVVRNRIRRHLRERFRTTRGNLAAFEVVIIARHRAKSSAGVELVASYDRCMGRLQRKLSEC